MTFADRKQPTWTYTFFICMKKVTGVLSGGRTMRRISSNFVENGTLALAHVNTVVEESKIEGRLLISNGSCGCSWVADWPTSRLLVDLHFTSSPTMDAQRWGPVLAQLGSCSSAGRPPGSTTTGARYVPAATWINISCLILQLERGH